MNKELLEEINKGNISKVALFTQDESPILYTEKYVKEKDKEIERLNNIIKDIKGQLNYLETYSSKEDVFEDMKRRLDRIESIVNRK
jgi:cysteinyl-tRNA synthetase